MASATDTISATLTEVDRLRATLKKKTTKQVFAQDERALAKATALAWFKTHRQMLAATAGASELQGVDELYQNILDASDRATVRSTYVVRLKKLREALIALRRQGIAAASAHETSTDLAPDFSPLIGDPLNRPGFSGDFRV
jgi:hypothetical protein